MIVILNNGTRIRVVNEMAQAICKNILKAEGGPRQWQWQLDANQNGVAGFNLNQVSAICPEEDIVSEPVVSPSESVVTWCKQMVALSKKIAPDSEKK